MRSTSNGDRGTCLAMAIGVMLEPGLFMAMAGPPPEPRFSAAFGFDSDRGVCVLFGGTADGQGQLLFGDTWEYDGSSWRFRGDTGPIPWFTGGGAFDPQDRVFRVYSGIEGTWDWDGKTWVLRSTQHARTLSGAALAYDERRGVMVMHGGWPTYPNPSWSETWEWTGQDWTRVSELGPTNQGSANLAYDSNRGVCVVFYGENTWEWDGRSWRIVATSGPSRRFSNIVYDSWRGVTVLFGGSYQGSYFGDTWEFDGTIWRQVATTGPSPRGGHMAFDSHRGVTVLFGGTDATGPLNDTWEWDGTAWTLITFCYPDCDATTGEGILDIFDFLCFGNRFAAGDPYACDCDASTGHNVCDIFDFLCFGNAFSEGCP